MTLIQTRIDILCNKAHALMNKNDLKNIEALLLDADKQLNEFDANRGQNFENFVISVHCNTRLKAAWSRLEHLILKSS